MLSDTTYQKASTAFGTAVGIANILGYTKKTEHLLDIPDDISKTISDDFDINYIIESAIQNKLYIELQREIYRLKQTNKRLKKEVSIYNRAYENVVTQAYPIPAASRKHTNNGNNRTNTK